MLAVTAAGAAGNIHKRLADALPALDLESNIPLKFGNWKLDEAIRPVLPAPDVRERLNKLYNTILSRTYVDTNGYRIMFLIAYGADQADRTTLAHLPESCYASQGFAVSQRTTCTLAMAEQSLRYVRLIARHGDRIEPISYWTTVGDVDCSDEFERRWARAKYALYGVVPDGMLVRVSSIDPDSNAAFRAHEQYIAELRMALATGTRSRIFGVRS